MEEDRGDISDRSWEIERYSNDGYYTDVTKLTSDVRDNRRHFMLIYMYNFI